MSASAKLKVGDQVRSTEDDRSFDLVGTVVEAPEGGVYYTIKFGESFDGWGEDERCWGVPVGSLVPVAEATGKFKVGDRVVARGYSRREGDCFGTVDRINEVASQAHASDWSVGAREGWLAFDQLELVTTPSTSAIVALIENGQPKPSHRPCVHASREAAETEASRLAGKHPGKEFGVYELVATKREAKVYDFEWQRLAAGGSKLLAVKELRRATGLGLATANDAVNDWLKREAA